MSGGNSICVHVDASGNHVFTYYPILIVGAGETGIAMGCQLKQQLRFDQFRIFERQSFLGGTWYSNKYPGVRCDVPAVFYSYSFAPNHDWSTFRPSGAEILKYLTDVAQKYEIVDKMQFNAEVTELRYLEHEKLWEATVSHLMPGIGDLTNKERQELLSEQGQGSIYLKQEIVRAKIAVSAAGGLVEPNPWPDVPGIGTFKGDCCHTARWNNQIDFHDKNVIVLGTGCSGAQVVPQLIEAPYNVKSVTQLMRTPPWVMPIDIPLVPWSKSDWEKYTPILFRYVPGLGRLVRLIVFAMSERDFLHLLRLRPENVARRKAYEERLMRYMKSKVPQEYWGILTPDYSAGCKRRIVDDGWLESLQSPKTTLTTRPLKSIQEQSITLGKGRTYPKTQESEDQGPEEKILPADIIILANGFELTTWLHPLRIVGKGGRNLQDVWDERGGPQAYMGTAMDVSTSSSEKRSPWVNASRRDFLMRSSSLVQIQQPGTHL